MLHHWLGWISLAICVLLVVKYIGRISKNKNINQLLRKIHKPLGIAVIGIAAIHGVISFIKNPQAILQNMTGSMLFLLILLLAGVFYAKARLKAEWFQIHRCLALALCAIIVIHIVVSFS